jgi:uncharacterized metal-binding protein YceD (DUF177 family)
VVNYFFFGRLCEIPTIALPLQPILKNEVVMDPFIAYSIPIQGLKVGIHHFNYLLDQDFFRHFEDTPIGVSRVNVEMELDKRSDMILLDFSIEGWVQAICDRCTAQIQLPVEVQAQLIIKFGDAEGETEDEVVFISRETSHLNVAKYLYEFSVLAMPITNTYDCENDPNPPCNREVLQYLEQKEASEKSNPLWDALKDFDKEN